MKTPRLSHQGLKVLKLFVEQPTSALAGADIMRAVHLTSGTVYPLLARLETGRFLCSRWERATAASLGRPRRRLYSITVGGLRMATASLMELGIQR